MKKIYNQVAQILLNTTLITVFFLFIVWGALELRHVVLDRGHVVISEAIKFDSYRLTPLDVAKETAAEFDAYASIQPFVYNPWTTLMAAPFDGRNLNVIRGPLFNYRATISEHEPGPDPELTIWCFGGSTLFGFGVPDNQTIPSHLQSILQERKGISSVKVLNFGNPHWFSTVELASFNALLASNSRPDIVIFLDGYNDMANLVAGRVTPFFSDQAQAAWERRRNDARRLLPWFSINESFPFLRVARYVQPDIKTPSQETQTFRKLEQFDSERVVQVFLDNVKKITALSEAYDVEPFFFLQPVPWFGKYTAEDVVDHFPYGVKDTALSAYASLVDAFSRNEHAVALHDTLYDHEAPFVDRVHYSDSANRLLAQRIADIIVGARPEN